MPLWRPLALQLVQQQTAIARERGEIERNEVPLRERESDLRSEIESAQEKEKIEVGEADERVVEAQTDGNSCLVPHSRSGAPGPC
eukprot:scaffold123105_cov30-Tisochrysis_lutea.AAC.10